MARYTGPITKKSRRLKTDLVGGDKNFDLRPFPPGQHGKAVHHSGRQRGGKRRLSVASSTHSGYNCRRRCVLEQIPTRPGLEACKDLLVLGQDGQNDDFN